MSLTDAELNQLVTLHITRGRWDETRCPVCGWPLRETIDQGCVPRNCSLRPAPAIRADAPADYAGERWQELYMALALTRRPIISAHGQTFSAYVMGLNNRRKSSLFEPTPGRALAIAALRAYGILNIHGVLKEEQL